MDINTASLIKYHELPLEVRVCAYISTRIKSTNPSGLLLSAMVRGSPGSRASEDNGLLYSKMYRVAGYVHLENAQASPSLDAAYAET